MKKLAVVFLSIMVLFACSSNDTSKQKQTKEEKKETRVSFSGVGDNLIHETVYQQAEADAKGSKSAFDFTKMYKNVKKDIQKADIAFINQETVLSGTELGLSGYPMFGSPTEIAQNLADTGFDLVNLATNHTLDKGQQGIDNALEAFSKTDIVTSGAYSNQKGYDTIPVFEKEGIKFSFLAYTYGTNGIEPPNPYSISYFSDEKITADVKKAKEISDVVIVSAHWGDENTFAPNEFQKHYAQLFADLGVDVVVGTHPHVIQPVTWLKGSGGNKTLVTYSLGNFLGGMLEVDNVLSGMINFDFVKDAKTKKITIENVVWTPLVIHFEGNQANILEERSNYSIYKLSDYTHALAKKHVLNGFEGQVVSLEYFQKKTKDVIDSQFLK